MLPEGYQFKKGSSKDTALLVKFMNLTYEELFPEQKDFSHLAKTVQQYFNKNTPLWWVIYGSENVACLWAGNAFDQEKGDRHAHIFLLYVKPNHRHQGIAKALLEKIQTWAKERGDRQISLMVYQHNQTALNLYEKLGYKPLSFWLVKQLKE
jgi:ribosomal protein S18 acetylase RimI-like enzyme